MPTNDTTRRGGRPRNAAIDGKNLSRAREAAGFTRRSLVAAMVGRGYSISRSSLIKYELNVVAPSAETLAHLCAVVGVDPARILRGPGLAA